MFRRLSLALAVAAAAGCTAATSPASGPALTHVEGLGSLHFPNSGAPTAQESFARGVLLLHSFEFGEAAEAFKAAQTADPGFALAYWGEAMTYNHPLWREQDRETALAALGRLAPTPNERSAKAPTERERGYLAAVEALYGEGTKTERDRAYMDAMAELSGRFPDDDEARAFHALAILGSRDGARDFATYMRAAAVAQPVFDRNPNHPGAAHYLIHAFDDPVHAPLGLPAARLYADIAPGAAHAQHMTSHIFVAMGMWKDVVSANIRARDTQDAANTEHGGHANVCGHYSSWLQYGHLMLGQDADAAALLDRCHERVSGSPSDSEVGYFLSMRARQILDTEDWTLTDRWTWSPPAGTAPSDTRRQFLYEWVNAFAAFRRGDPAPARALVSGRPADDTLGIQADQLRGLLAIAAGRGDDGIALLRGTAAAEEAQPFEFGPPRIVKPTLELLAEELARLGRTDDARRAADRAHERNPGRRVGADRKPA